MDWMPQVREALKAEGLWGRGRMFDAVLNPPNHDDAEESIYIRPLSEVLTLAKGGDVVDVYVYAKPEAEGWDRSLEDNVLVTLEG